MHYQWALTWLERSIKDRFPAVAGPSLLRRQAASIRDEARKLRDNAAKKGHELEEVLTAEIYMEEADALERYARHLLAKALEQERQTLPREHLEHLAAQRRVFIGNVLAHGALASALEDLGEDSPPDEVLRHAVVRLAQPSSRRELRRAVRRAAVDFEIPLPQKDVGRTVNNTLRALQKLLHISEHGDACG